MFRVIRGLYQRSTYSHRLAADDFYQASPTIKPYYTSPYTVGLGGVPFLYGPWKTCTGSSKLQPEASKTRKSTESLLQVISPGLRFDGGRWRVTYVSPEDSANFSLQAWRAWQTVTVYRGTPLDFILPQYRLLVCEILEKADSHIKSSYIIFYCMRIKDIAITSPPPLSPR